MKRPKVGDIVEYYDAVCLVISKKHTPDEDLCEECSCLVYLKRMSDGFYDHDPSPYYFTKFIRKSTKLERLIYETS